MWRVSTFESLQYRNFRWIWLGQTTHAIALWAQMIALPLLVLEITGNDPAQLGAVVAVRVVPTLLLGVWAGVVADWFNRRTILVITKWNNLFLSIIIAVLVAAGWAELWHLYVWQALRGATQVFDQPARYSMIPSILPDHLVTNAMALLSSTQNVMRILGAAGAGLVAEFFGLSGAFIAIAVMAGLSTITTHMLCVEANRRPGKVGIRGMAAGLAEGARFTLHHSTIRGVLIISLIYFTFGMSYMQVFAPLFAIEVLDIGRSGLGLMLALTGAGALVTALTIANTQPVRLGVILPLGVAAMGAALFVFSLTSYLPGIAGIIVPLVMITVVGALQTTFMSLSRALMLHAAPPEMRGRVLAFISLDRAMMAAGGAVGGVLAAWQGVQVVQMIFGLICAAGGISVFIFLGDLRSFVTTRRDEPAAAGPEQASPAAGASGATSASPD